MARYRSTQYKSEEAKRNIKVDLRRIPEWEAELESIRNQFRQFNFSEIVSAATLIQNVRGRLYSNYSNRERERKLLEQWKNTLDVDLLIYNIDDFSAPDLMEKDMVEEIRSMLKGTEEYLAKCKAKGIANGLWDSFFTSKVDAREMQRIEQQKAKYLVLSHEIPKIENALSLLAKVSSLSHKFSSHMLKIQCQLSLAKEKKEAIERFDAKHGNAFAKAAVADGKTRSRATSLKRLVKKTKDCPYCGNDLGTNPHLDHIYPVSKGGLSIVENLVWCCSTCNGLKTDKGLMQFLKERDLSIEQTLTRLHSIGKHV